MIDSLSGLVANMHRQRAAQQGHHGPAAPGILPLNPANGGDPPPPPVDPRLNNPNE